MIFPIFLGLPSFRQIITWLLVILNVIFYIQYSSKQDVYTKKINSLYEDQFYLKAQGQVFAQIIDRNPNESNLILDKISRSVLQGNIKDQVILGKLAFKNPLFKRLSEKFEYQGDMVQYEYWKQKYIEISSIQKEDPSYWFGVSSLNHSWKSWVSYQFLHGGFFHLFSNLWFLLIFGYFLERYIGSFYFLTLYIASGVVAALFFQGMSGLSVAPLIGASGSISGVMGFVMVLYWKKSIRSFYWVLPVQGYYGIAKIPAKLVFLMWIISDLAGYIGNLEELGGVAHAAHVGGFLFGISCATIFVLGKKGFLRDVAISK